MFEGVPTWPDAGRCWEVVDKHKVGQQREPAVLSGSLPPTTSGWPLWAAAGGATVSLGDRCGLVLGGAGNQLERQPQFGQDWVGAGGAASTLGALGQWQVSVFYTAPTAIRSLMGCPEELVTKHSRKSLRLLGTVGEPINPAAWKWYYEVRRASHIYPSVHAHLTSSCQC